MVVADGLEPSTPALSRRCSNQLSYATIRVSGGAGRSRTDDILLAKQALYQLSYGPRRDRSAARDPVGGSCRCYQIPGKERKVNPVLRKFIFCVFLAYRFVVSLAGHSNNIRPMPVGISVFLL